MRYPPLRPGLARKAAAESNSSAFFAHFSADGRFCGEGAHEDYAVEEFKRLSAPIFAAGEVSAVFLQRYQSYSLHSTTSSALVL